MRDRRERGRPSVGIDFPGGGGGVGRGATRTLYIYNVFFL